jgi:hypothetical protein
MCPFNGNYQISYTGIVTSHLSQTKRNETKRNETKRNENDTISSTAFGVNICCKQSIAESERERMVEILTIIRRAKPNVFLFL